MWCRQAARLLREEQDREYTESLQLDQLREAQRRAEEEQMANGSLNVPSSETIGNHKEKDNNQDELAMKQSIEDKRAKLAVDVSVKGTPGTCFIKFQLSNGNRVERCFREDDTLEVLLVIRTMSLMLFRSFAISSMLQHMIVNWV